MDYQVAIIGGGPAGYTAAETAAKAGLSVVLFEKNNVGGVCLNEGCIPTKTLLYSAKVLDGVCHASKYGIRLEGKSAADPDKIIARKNKVVRKLTLGIKARLTAAGVTLIPAEASLVDAHTVQCGTETYTCAHLILCTGSETVIPPIPGIAETPYWTHREALQCKELPHSLVIVGGGVIGMEFASYFRSMGTEVTVIEMQDEILGGMDGELAAALRTEYAKRGVHFLLSARVTAVAAHDEGVRLSYDRGGETGEVKAERMLLSVGRRPATQGLGLERLSLAKDERGRIAVDNWLQTSVPGVYACGDINGLSLLAHTAVRQAEVAVHHVLGKPDEMSYRAIPSVVYTNPEIASVGATEESLHAAGRTYRVVRLPMSHSGRFVAENEGTNGICKALVDEDGVLLGMHLLGNPASELIAMAGIWVEDRRTLAEWKRYIFPHPTVGEIFRELD